MASNDKLVLVLRLKLHPIQNKAETIDRKKNKGRFFLFKGRNSRVITGKCMTKSNVTINQIDEIDFATQKTVAPFSIE